MKVLVESILADFHSWFWRQFAALLRRRAFATRAASRRTTNALTRSLNAGPARPYRLFEHDLFGKPAFTFLDML
jgi:hypothetical protein